MQISFSKMHGIGNEFMLINAVESKIPLRTELVRSWADRTNGVGFDQLLVLENRPGSKHAPDYDSIDFSMRIFNADGSEARQCGNGVRCAAQFARHCGLTHKNTVHILVGGRIVIADILSEQSVRVDMGEPVFEPREIPFSWKEKADSYVLDIGGEVESDSNLRHGDKSLRVGVVSMGNPHAVIQTEELADYPVQEIGAKVQMQSVFPESVNVGFMQLIERNRIQLRVFERGVGETAACGSGACAAVVIGRQWNLLDAQTCVQLQGGQLDIEWQGSGSVVFMTGATEFMCDGEVTV